MKETNTIFKQTDKKIIYRYDKLKQFYLPQSNQPKTLDTLHREDISFKVYFQKDMNQKKIQGQQKYEIFKSKNFEEFFKQKQILNLQQLQESARKTRELDLYLNDRTNSQNINSLEERLTNRSPLTLSVERPQVFKQDSQREQPNFNLNYERLSPRNIIKLQNNIKLITQQGSPPQKNSKQQFLSLLNNQINPTAHTQKSTQQDRSTTLNYSEKFEYNSPNVRMKRLNDEKKLIRSIEVESQRINLNNINMNHSLLSGNHGLENNQQFDDFLAKLRIKNNILPRESLIQGSSQRYSRLISQSERQQQLQIQNDPKLIDKFSLLVKQKKSITDHDGLNQTLSRLQSSRQKYSNLTDNYQTISRNSPRERENYSTELRSQSKDGQSIFRVNFVPRNIYNPGIISKINNNMDIQFKVNHQSRSIFAQDQGNLNTYYDDKKYQSSKKSQDRDVISPFRSEEANIIRNNSKLNLNEVEMEEDFLRSERKFNDTQFSRHRKSENQVKLNSQKEKTNILNAIIAFKEIIKRQQNNQMSLYHAHNYQFLPPNLQEKEHLENLNVKNANESIDMDSIRYSSLNPNKTDIQEVPIGLQTKEDSDPIMDLMNQSIFKQQFSVKRKKDETLLNSTLRPIERNNLMPVKPVQTSMSNYRVSPQIQGQFTNNDISPWSSDTQEDIFRQSFDKGFIGQLK